MIGRCFLPGHFWSTTVSLQWNTYIMSAILRFKPFRMAYKKFHNYFLLEKEPTSTLADLDFDTDIRKSVQRLQSHQWTVAEAAHYSFLTLVILFVYVIFPALFLFKTPILAAFGLCCLMPLTLQFFVSALPIFSWLALFFSASKIPVDWKPVISVKFLPAMETILYGDNLSNVLAATNNSVLDVMAWLPYGIIHFVSPFVVALFIFLFAPPTSLRSFGFAFGYMNLSGVLIQLFFPSAPPWYKNLHGLEPANYLMNGSPGGLGRIDALFGVDMFTTTFENSPLVFGAFPSLHSGCAVMDVLFLSWLFPKYGYVWWGYACLLWWSTMYLTHHYFIDLIFGAILSVLVFTYVKYTKLPVVDASKFCRWSYTSVELPNVAARDPLLTFVPLHGDAEEGHLHPFYNHPSLDASFEMAAMSVSRESVAAPPIIPEETAEEAETDSSASNLVFDAGFDAETHVSLHASSMSLNEMAIPVSAYKPKRSV